MGAIVLIQWLVGNQPTSPVDSQIIKKNNNNKASDNTRRKTRDNCRRRPIFSLCRPRFFRQELVGSWCRHSEARSFQSHDFLSRRRDEDDHDEVNEIKNCLEERPSVTCSPASNPRSTGSAFWQSQGRFLDVEQSERDNESSRRSRWRKIRRRKEWRRTPTAMPSRTFYLFFSLPCSCY